MGAQMKADLQIDEPMRLNRFLAESGVCSRRDADDLIFGHKVTVNGKVIDVPSFRIDPNQDAIKVSGKRIHPQPMVYILMNKPEGIISTLSDPEKRTTVVDLLKGVKARVYPVGRLDYNTSGVLMLTNDGVLAQRLMHPRYGFTKTYHAKVSGVPSQAAILKLCHGVRIPGWSGRYELTLPTKVRLLKKSGKHSLLEITLREGRQHQVKKMCAAIGHPVEKLIRFKFGFLSSAGLPMGGWRYLSTAEVDKISSFKPEPVAFKPNKVKSRHKLKSMTKSKKPTKRNIRG
jgi:23S rRNA pseudouridine2605 synthase